MPAYCPRGQPPSASPNSATRTDSGPGTRVAARPQGNALAAGIRTGTDCGAGSALGAGATGAGGAGGAGETGAGGAGTGDFGCTGSLTDGGTTTGGADDGDGFTGADDDGLGAGRTGTDGRTGGTLGFGVAFGVTLGTVTVFTGAGRATAAGREADGEGLGAGLGAATGRGGGAGRFGRVAGRDEVLDRGVVATGAGRAGTEGSAVGTRALMTTACPGTEEDWAPMAQMTPTPTAKVASPTLPTSTGLTRRLGIAPSASSLRRR